MSEELKPLKPCPFCGGNPVIVQQGTSDKAMVIRCHCGAEWGHIKVHRIEICVTDFDDVGAEEIKSIFENSKYPNDCISPEVKNIETKDIGEWSDDHPLKRKHE